MPLTVRSLTQYVRTRLGGSRRCVELSDEDILTGIADALATLSRMMPLEGFDAIPNVSSAVTRYVVDKPNLIDVADVEFMDAGMYGSAEEFPFGTFLEKPAGTAVTASLYGTGGAMDAKLAERYLQLSYMQDERKMASMQPTWRGAWEVVTVPPTPRQASRASKRGRKARSETKRVYALYIDVDDGFQKYRVSYRYLYGYSADDNPLLGLPAITLNYEAWIGDYSVACCRILLGDIRSKFGAIPLGDGQPGEIDGKDQILRGERDKEKLELDLFNRQRVNPIVFA